MDFCNLNNSNKNISAAAGGGSGGSSGGGACGCGGGYEPLTADWFKEWAGVIAVVLTLIILLFGGSK